MTTDAGGRQDPDGYTFTFHDTSEDSDEELAERCAFTAALQAEAWPEDPPTPLAQFVANHRAAPSRLRRRAVRARAGDGTLVGTAAFTVDPDFDTNPDMSFIGLHVLPAHRRRGVGTRLLDGVLVLLEREGRTRVLADTLERVPAGASFARAIGAEPKQEAAMNHLPIAKVDRALLERWAAEGPVRAAGYELVGWDGRCPDEHLDGFIELILVMNDAPRDAIEMNDFTVTPAQVREREAQLEAVGVETWTLAARRVADGAYAGFHDLSWNPEEPEHMYVGATGVKPEHRGHALGKWLKAAMTLRVLDERPQVTSIRTGNADSNDAMLGINRLMGYERLVAETVWEIPVADAKAWVATKLSS